MKSSLFRKALRAAQLLSLAGVAALTLNGCGGGGGASGDPPIAPQTLEGVTIRLFDSFTVKLYKLAGEAGNESGAGDFDGINSSFNLGFTDGGNTTAETVEVPSIITNVRYEYVRTSSDTGRITFFWSGLRERSAAEQALLSESDYSGYQIFWERETMSLDVLFVDNFGVITNTSSRVRGYQKRTIKFFRPENAPPVLMEDSTVDLEFDSQNIVFTVDGRPLPTGYNLIVSENTPSDIVWENLQGRSLVFTSAGDVPYLRAAYQSAAGGLIKLPGVDGIDDSGTMLVDSPSEGVLGGSGDFGYRRTGGANASFSIQYDVPPGDGDTRIDYRLAFTTLSAGTWTDSNGNFGTFYDDLYSDNP